VRRPGFVTVGLAIAVVAGSVIAPATSAPAGDRDRVDVVAAFYPLAEAAVQVGKGRVDVRNLTPPGVEPHDFELSTREIDALDGADLAIVMGHDFQPAVEKAADRRNGATLVVLDQLRGRLRPDDPHVWLDPHRMIEIVDATAAALARVDERGAATYRTNAQSYSDALRALDDEYRTGLADCERRQLVTSHDAFGYLADAYGLEPHGVSGISPDAEPDPKRLGQLADLARDEGVTTVFSEELVSPRVARTLAREAGGLRVDVLSPLEGLSPKEHKRGDDYVSVMRENLARLRRALDCR
jgi:zinc transport system substrate-binding protein